ncbi:hypothetical protein Sango_1196900 [Sesamum angolense]|uniref:DUF4218 domain-containing protein n=1 Tax=Sesamum angolense TaxID=2727404 RepID=A0AAE2BX26_9LAMI|nr:hypothetical protein Sango_1196900 [Sesamum angolense]
MGVSLAGSGNEVVAAGAVALAFVEVLHDNRLVAGKSTLEEYNRLVWLQKLHHFPRFCGWLTGDQILDRVANISPAVEMPLPLHDDYGSDHKWTKKNIFWDLPYWSKLLIRHKLDVMHIEKNTHNCHVFMQKLIPIAFHKMLPEHVWSALTEVSLLFQSICLTTLDVHKLHELENNIAIILCNLEKIFPPAFFDSIEHLIVHLPYEARVGDRCNTEVTSIPYYFVNGYNFQIELHNTASQP